MAGEAGIRVNIEIVKFGALLSQLAAHRYEAALLGWSGRPDPDGNIYNYWPKEYKFLSPKVQGFVHNGDGMIRLRTVWLTP
jgi:peptide/nickel transport system substrate-binding protein